MRTCIFRASCSSVPSSVRIAARDEERENNYEESHSIGASCTQTKESGAHHAKAFPCWAVNAGSVRANAASCFSQALPAHYQTREANP